MADSTVQNRNDAAREAPALLPPVDVVEDAAGITLHADLPGVPKESLALQVEADTLTIAGDIRLPVVEGMEASHSEVSVPRYRRVFTLAKDLDVERISAEFTNGVLKLRIPKASHAQRRRVDIAIG